MAQLPYMDEPWFALLREACEGSSRTVLATRLGVSQPTVCQVLNGSGLYGSGQSGTRRIADKVVHLLGQYACPHLTEQHGAPRVISAAECRQYAHRNPPTGSPRDLAHWQACRKCRHFGSSAPPKPREFKPRKRATDPSVPSPTATPTDQETDACSTIDNT